MKKVLLSISALALTAATIVGIQSCNLKKIVKKDLVFQTDAIEITIPATTGPTSYADMGSIDQILNVDQFIKDNTEGALSINDLSAAHINWCKITMSNPDATNNFANFSDAGVALNSDPANGNADVSMIVNGNPDTYKDNMDLPVDTNKDMLPYLKASKIAFIYGGALRRSTTKEIKIKVQCEYSITVGG